MAQPALAGLSECRINVPGRILPRPLAGKPGRIGRRLYKDEIRSVERRG
jgi:hypothetical protein